MKKGGKRFEVACYKNKVTEYRSGVEKDLDEVLQIAQVFINVSKGQAAKSEDLQKAFGTTDVAQCVGEILMKGELQVGEKERSHQLGNLWKDIATQVAEKCVDPSTQRPYSVGLIEKAMSEIHFNVRSDKPAKSQALECIRQLQEKGSLKIQRARMRVRITMGSKDGKRLREQVKAMAVEGGIEEDDMGADEWEAVSRVAQQRAWWMADARALQIMLIDPGAFKLLNELMDAETKGRGKVESMGYAAITKEERLE